ncbi:MAG: winged helix-turn-helix domain-containing protein [Myxococcota bacterium]
MTEVIGLGETVVWLDARLVQRGPRIERLTPLEARVLRYLWTHADRAVAAEELLEQVWNVRRDLQTHTVATIVHRLRQKLEPHPAHPTHLVTRRGRGYRLLGGRPLQDPTLTAISQEGAVRTAEALAPVAPSACWSVCEALLHGASGPLAPSTEAFIHGRIALLAVWRHNAGAASQALEKGWRCLQPQPPTPWGRRAAHRLHLLGALMAPTKCQRAEELNRASEAVKHQPYAQAMVWLHRAWLGWEEGDPAAERLATQAAMRFEAVQDHRLVAQTRTYHALHTARGGRPDHARRVAIRVLEGPDRPETRGWHWLAARLLASLDGDERWLDGQALPDGELGANFQQLQTHLGAA